MKERSLYGIKPLWCRKVVSRLLEEDCTDYYQVERLNFLTFASRTNELTLLHQPLAHCRIRQH